MQSDSLSYKTLKNISYSFIGYVFPIVFSVFITPVVVHKLGVVDYGVFLLMNTVAAFLGLLDVGLSVALIKYISEYTARKDFKNLTQLLNSANSMYLIIGTVGLGVFLLIGYYFLPLFKIQGEAGQHILVVCLIAGLIFFVNAVNSVYTVVPNALQRFDIATKLNLFQLTFLNLSMLVLVVMGYKLKVIFLVNLLSVVILTFTYRFFTKRILPEVKLGFAWNRLELGKSFKFGILAFVTNLASNSLIQLDRFIVPIFTGPAALTFYSLPGNVAQKTAGVTGSLGTVFFPLTSAMSGSGDIDTIRRVYIKTFRNIAIISAGLTVAILAFADKILLYWVGREFADRGTMVLYILACTYFLLALFGPLTHFLLGLGKVKFMMYTSVGLALLNILLMMLLVPKFGIVGAAWAYLGGVLPIPLIFYWTEKHFLKLAGMGTFYLRLYGKIILTSALYFIIMKYSLYLMVKDFKSLVVVGPLAVVWFFLLYFFLGFYEAEDVAVVKQFAHKIRGRIGFF